MLPVPIVRSKNTPNVGVCCSPVSCAMAATATAASPVETSSQNPARVSIVLRNSIANSRDSEGPGANRG